MRYIIENDAGQLVEATPPGVVCQIDERYFDLIKQLPVFDLPEEKRGRGKMMAKTMYQEATGAEETCMMCPHRLCPNRDPDSFECPARVNERRLGQIIKSALEGLTSYQQDSSDILQILSEAEIE